MKKKQTKRKSTGTPLVADMLTHDSDNTGGKQSLGQKLLRWIAMGVFIAVSFVLGNVVGNMFVSGQLSLDSVKTNISSLFGKMKAPAADTASQQAAPAASAPTTAKIGGVDVKLPGPGSTAEEQAAFAKVIDANAKQVASAEVKEGCLLSPEVILAPEGTQLTMKNIDTQEHTLSMGDTQESVKLAPGASQGFTAKLKGAGIYGITCDGKILAGHLRIVTK